VSHVDRCDTIFFATLHNMLIVDILRPIPEEFVKDLRYVPKKKEKKAQREKKRKKTKV
jgi:hypothetical protein